MAVSVRTLTYVLPLLHQPPPRAVVGRRSPPRFPRLVFVADRRRPASPPPSPPQLRTSSRRLSPFFDRQIIRFVIRRVHLSFPRCPSRSSVPFLVPSSSIREQLSPLTHDDSFFFCRDLGGMFDEIGVSRLDGLFLGCYLRRIALRVKL